MEPPLQEPSQGPDTARLLLLAKGADRVYKVFLIRITFAVLAFLILATTPVAGINAPAALSWSPGQELGIIDDVYDAALEVSIGIAGYSLLFLLGIMATELSLYYLYTGMKMLSQYDSSRYGIGLLGAKLLIISTVCLISGSMTIIAAASAHSVAAAAAGALTALLSLAAIIIADVLVIIALWRLDGEHGDGRLWFGISLILVSVLLSALTFLSPPLLLIGIMIEFMGEVIAMLGAKGIRDAVLRRAASATQAPRQSGPGSPAEDTAP